VRLLVCRADPLVRSHATVIGALRRFLPEFLQEEPPLWPQQRRALRAITQCRTAELGGRAFACQSCAGTHFAFHSCNHKACPQCGRAATAQWVQREQGKLIHAPYFLVTFTLPSELRDCFFGPHAKAAYDLFFAAVSGALSEKLATAKGLRAHVNGFTAVLHTWNQQLGFHPHIHCLVPGAGLDARGRVVRVQQPHYLIHLPLLQSAFRQHLRRRLEEQQWPVDPTVWGKDWGVHIQPAGNGASALKYLSAYVARTAIRDERLVHVSADSVTFRWKDRADGNRRKLLTLSGEEFVRRYLRHVLPRGLRSIRYYGFCHPAAQANRLRLRLHTGLPVDLGAPAALAQPTREPPACPHCGGATRLLRTFLPERERGPP
jgi:hypothetical protein